ncbi:MAG: hypothetical protein JO337_03960 [Acidimicrobiales bacterium]|nr:hypothetical protein [Acidimicrobiales bacterium]
MLSLDTAVNKIRRRADVDPDLADTLRYLAEDELPPTYGFEAPSQAVLDAARRVNRARQADRLRSRQVDALETAEVVRLVASLQDRRGVDRRRRRGQLLGWRSGSRTLHPTWQFDPARGDTRPGLPTVLAALGQVTSDAQAADELMRAPRHDLDGRSLADLFAAGRVETVVWLILASTDQS